MWAHRLHKLCQSGASRLRRWGYQAQGMQIEGPVWLERIEWPTRPACIILGKGAALDRGVTLLATNDQARIRIGESCYINRHTMIDASERVEIGSQTMVGPFCYITDHDHQFGPGLAPGESPLVTVPTVIGQRCWLGAHVSVLKGVTIGDGSVVGAGSVVTKSLPAGIVAVGNPARIVRELPPL
jgi:carbonic anhydrase/acetyltransferase-like protein (isoleucine patch superfamily)